MKQAVSGLAGDLYINQMHFSPELKAFPSRYLGKEEITARKSVSPDNQDYIN